MSIFLPFNFNPESVAVKTGSYSIPTGKYAYVTAECRDGGTFTIGGVTALQAPTNTLTAVAVTEVINTTDAQYTVPANMIFEGQIFNDAPSSVEVGGAKIMANTTTIAVPIKAGPSQLIDIKKGGGSGTASVIGYVRTLEPNTTITASFWIDAGVTLNITGSASFTVSEYSIT